MKTFTHIIPLLLVAGLGMMLTGCFAKKAQTISITNPSPIERKDELVTFNRSYLSGKLGSLPGNRFIKITFNNKPVTVQFDDLDNDGTWDEAVFLHTFQPSGKDSFLVKSSRKQEETGAVVRAHVRQRHKLADQRFAPSVRRDTMPYNNLPTDFSKQKLPPYLTEGPGWENDKVGFRKYFDVRNANDIWGKVTGRMVLEEVGVDPSKIYHHFDSSWGMDILKVGKSLGGGGLALLTKVNGRDSIIRFGKDVAQVTYEQVADGPVRAIFRINYKSWKIGGLPQPINATEEISIWGGQYFYQNKVTVSGAPEGSSLATGIIDFYVPQYQPLNAGEVGGIYTWGRQSENGDNLGLALLASKSDYTGAAHIEKTGDVSNAILIKQNITPNQPAIHRLYVGWEKTDSQFATRIGFGMMMLAETLKMGAPLVME